MTRNLVTATARPFVKMAGGKTALLPELLARVPKRFDAYHEPFLGGGALFWALAPRLRRASLSDLNARLMHTWKAVHKYPDELIRRLRTMKNDEAFYYRVRDKYEPAVECSLDCTAMGAWFIFLNKTCYNGLYRENQSGKMNTPFGHRKNPTICDEPLLRACHALMRTIPALHRFTESYTEVIGRASKGDFVYFDPPYVPTSKTASFTGYIAGGFGADDQQELVEIAHTLKRRGVKVLLSNSDTPETRKLYARGFKIETVTAPRAINSVGSKRGAVPELLIT